MKIIPQKKLHFLTAVFVLSFSALYAESAAQFDSSQDYQSSNNFLMEEFNYQGPHNYYGELGVGGMESGDFDGYSIAARLGTHVGDKLQHGFEFEFLFARMKTNIRTLSGTDTRVRAVTRTGTFLVADSLTSQGTLEEYFWMLNYRYEGSVGEKMKFLYYIGGGGGVALMNFRNKQHRSSTILSIPPTPLPSGARTLTDTDIEPALQFFVGGGIPLSERVSLMVRGRILWVNESEKVVIGRLDSLQTAAKSKTYQLGAEVALSITF